MSYDVRRKHLQILSRAAIGMLKLLAKLRIMDIATETTALEQIKNLR